MTGVAIGTGPADVLDLGENPGINLGIGLGQSVVLVFALDQIQIIGRSYGLDFGHQFATLGVKRERTDHNIAAGEDTVFALGSFFDPFKAEVSITRFGARDATAAFSPPSRSW